MRPLRCHATKSMLHDVVTLHYVSHVVVTYVAYLPYVAYVTSVTSVTSVTGRVARVGPAAREATDALRRAGPRRIRDGGRFRRFPQRRSHKITNRGPPPHVPSAATSRSRRARYLCARGPTTSGRRWVVPRGRAGRGGGSDGGGCGGRHGGGCGDGSFFQRCVTSVTSVTRVDGTFLQWRVTRRGWMPQNATLFQLPSCPHRAQAASRRLRRRRRWGYLKMSGREGG